MTPAVRDDLATVVRLHGVAREVDHRVRIRILSARGRRE
jgi:hypothetical protein